MNQDRPEEQSLQDRIVRGMQHVTCVQSILVDLEIHGHDKAAEKAMCLLANLLELQGQQERELAKLRKLGRPAA